MARQLVTFEVAGRKFGIDLWAVSRVAPAVWVTNLPHSPHCVAGVIDIEGVVSPVLDVRLLWQLGEGEPAAPREVGLEDQFIVVASGARYVVLWVDTVQNVIPCDDADWVALEEVLDNPGACRYFEGAMKLQGEIILVCDPAALLVPDTLELPGPELVS